MTDQGFPELSISKKIINDYEKNINLVGLSADQFALLFDQSFKYLKFDHKKRSNLILTNTEDEAQKIYNSLEGEDVYYYQGLERDIYSSIIQNEGAFTERILIADKVLNNLESITIISTHASAKLFLPELSFFQSQNLKLRVDDIIEPEEIVSSLVKMGYSRSITVEEPGSFAMKGEILDIYPFGDHPVRLNFFDTLIESIHLIDSNSLKTLKEKPLQKFVISKGASSIINNETSINFKNQYPRPRLDEKEKLDRRKRIFENLSNGQTFENYQLYISYFFPNPTTLLEISDHLVVWEFNREEAIKDHELYLEALNEDFALFSEVSEIHIPEPNKIFNLTDLPKSSVCISEFDNNLDSQLRVKIPLSIEKFGVSGFEIGNLNEKIKLFIKKIDEHLMKGHKLFLCSQNAYRVSEIKKYFEFYESRAHHSLRNIPYTIDDSFIYKAESLIFLSDNDFFSQRKIKNKSSKKELNTDYDLFAEQISTLKDGDFVIHKTHGVGIFRGVEPLTMGNNTTDYLTIEYKDQDKVYVPVYKLDLIQKYATSNSKATVADLKKNKFEAIKKKAKESVKKLAFSLIELQAKRELKQGYAFSEPDNMFNDFSLSFPYQETPDQEKAIDAVIEDMTSKKPMDRLICGDVGFGKTEVAIRASYKAVLDNKQVAILVPTTILSYQHANSFRERFKNYPVVIESISRLRTAKEVRDIEQRLKEGKIDILIGTHKILSDSFKYKDLGLLIIDEEQRFGVGHKEKLKLLKENVDTLTMTATPIPRTLQLSFLGIKELSLIKTPPPKRQSIKTYVIKEDNNTLRLAIEKELNRGGQIYIVHNKVSDIEIFTGKIRELAPKARIVFAHGQLPERELEKRITAFYRHEFDILISTTIIESGIDIPNANTMIIDRADTFGLSQLHQLRGRIGRSNRKAYAYFVIPKFRKISEISAKRLKALQTFAELGSGFSISSSDLEIRGAGDILGPEQSGHINNIGLELYMELLKDAIDDIKGNTRPTVHHVDIQTSFDAFIPESYIESDSLRLKTYKQFSSISNIDALMEKTDLLSDQYGPIPEEFLTLVKLIKVKIEAKQLGIVFIKVFTSKINIKFSQEMIDNNSQLRDQIIGFFTQRPKIYKINPDYSINCIFKDKINADTLYEFICYLKENLK